MDVRLLPRLLANHRRLREHDRWSRSQLLAHQARELERLRAHALTRSRFYRRFHQGLARAPLDELPVLTKATLMGCFDEVVTDPALHLGEVEAHLAGLCGDERFAGGYRVAATAGTTGRRGVFLWNSAEWATVLASYIRSTDWAGVGVGVTSRHRTAVVSSRTPWHQSARVGASVDSPFLPTLRVDSGDPVEQVVDQLNRFRPQVLVAYASMARLLAEEQLAARLAIAPRQVFTASEVLTADSQARIEQAWAVSPFNVYAATETAGIASECERHRLHLFEDLVIPEVVDERNWPVPPGEYGARLLVSVLFSRTLPLVRYELSDSARLSPPDERCECGRPYALLADIQGRQEDVLHLPTRAGGEVAVQPAVFHRVMDTVTASGWQIRQEADGFTVLLAGAPADAPAHQLAADLRRELERLDAAAPHIEVRTVPAIPRTPLGKAPLIRANPTPKGCQAVRTSVDRRGHPGSNERLQNPAHRRPNRL